MTVPTTALGPPPLTVASIERVLEVIGDLDQPWRSQSAAIQARRLARELDSLAIEHAERVLVLDVLTKAVASLWELAAGEGDGEEGA